ncbi:MAG TPA: 2-oxo acid dehydrogenase subunit E2 [Candidatus Atribacteria bacterium]|uniref:Dihydrolipoamide acetyltransferase component of pyruvate dehydrogenase complex n=1 Tax=candidate division TA06 bacterium 34_109 TaxID=1635277 RepID=A0A101I0C2_UNCT6|nr:MAG: Catalytic domain of components of various dehydrogenase complexe [candidate division TA06 bacterium 34_109]HBY57674.1 2-oxo acid dehydrogenase subunit E2 [Candidatus Atribacteria bacterium]
MAEVVIMPKLGLSMQKGKVVKWLRKEGESVKKGEPLLEIETEKIVNEVESPISGILLKIYVKEGETVPILTPLGVIGELGEKIDEEKEKIGIEAKEGEELKNKSVDKKLKTIPPLEQTSEIKASPVAVEYAKKLGVNLDSIKGTGPGGRIMKKDVEKYLEVTHPNNFPRSEESKEKELDEGVLGSAEGRGEEGERRIPYTGIRKIIGDRLSQSKFTAPHIYFANSIDMSKILKLRDFFEERFTSKISISEFIVFVVARVLMEQPKINCSLIDEEIVYHQDINIGIAVALEEGIIVPVIRNADRKSLMTISEEMKNLVRISREGRLMPDDYKGGTFTVSNLGMYGVEQFTSIINPPEAAILAVGSIKKMPMVVEEKEKEILEVRPLAKLTLSVDHRVIDGKAAADFLNQLKCYLEFPELLVFK